MNFGKLASIFKDHASNLRRAKDSTARFRATNYERVVELVESKHGNNEKVTKAKLENMGLTPHMLEKTLEVLNRKQLVLIDTKSKRARSPIKTATKMRSKSRSRSRSQSSARSHSKERSNNLLLNLTNIMGIGEERAKQLIHDGLKSVGQLKTKKWIAKVPEETKLFLQLKPAEKIPHEDIVALEPYILKLQKPDMKITLVGSYRRQKAMSSDIDVMIVSDSPNILYKFLSALNAILPNRVFSYLQGKDKLSILLNVSNLINKPNAIYKLDAFRVEPANRVPMLLYSTGSKPFNVVMRARAKHQGYLLNQNGLFKSGKKVEGLLTEKDYFDILKMPYREPKDRR